MTNLASETLCFAHGRPGDWEALCVDFDIAVQGESFRDVQRQIELAVADYVLAVEGEEADQRSRLLRRRAPRSTVLFWSGRVLLSAIRHLAGDDRETTASFPVALSV